MFYNWWVSFIVKYYVVIKRELDVWTEVHPKLGNRRVSPHFGHVTKHPSTRTNTSLGSYYCVLTRLVSCILKNQQNGYRSTVYIKSVEPPTTIRMIHD